MAPLKLPIIVSPGFTTTYFHNEKVMAPLKHPDGTLGYAGMRNFHNEKVMAPLKLNYNDNSSLLTQAISITKKLWPH